MERKFWADRSLADLLNRRDIVDMGSGFGLAVGRRTGGNLVADKGGREVLLDSAHYKGHSEKPESGKSRSQEMVQQVAIEAACEGTPQY